MLRHIAFRFRIYHQLKSVTVSMTPTAKCYASLLYEYEAEIRLAARTEKAIGLDFSMESLFVSSEEEIRTEVGFLHRYRKQKGFQRISNTEIKENIYAS